MAGQFSEVKLTLVCQVSKAKANHKVDTSNKLLRGINFPGDGKVVYLGNIAAAIISQLENPETPEFIKMPNYNEQKWQMKTNSGNLKITITSDSYWGFGLFNSGYLNILEITGPVYATSRLLFDLTASTANKPWDFRHKSAIEKYLTKNIPNFSQKINQQNWLEQIEICRKFINENIGVLDDAISHMENKVNQSPEITGWSKDKARVNIASSKYDLNIAKEALNDENIPSVERALARIEAMLIEADPDNAINDEEESDELSSKSYISTSDDYYDQLTEEDLPMVDLTSSEE